MCQRFINVGVGDISLLHPLFSVLRKRWARSGGRACLDERSVNRYRLNFGPLDHQPELVKLNGNAD